MLLHARDLVVVVVVVDGDGVARAGVCGRSATLRRFVFGVARWSTTYCGFMSCYQL
jgi:hypothetical protein